MHLFLLLGDGQVNVDETALIPRFHNTPPATAVPDAGEPPELACELPEEEPAPEKTCNAIGRAGMGDLAASEPATGVVSKTSSATSKENNSRMPFVQPADARGGRIGRQRSAVGRS